jgi:hypothetical protein
MGLPERSSDAISSDPALATTLQNPETLESVLHALRNHAIATNTLNRPESIPSTSTTSDWRRISVGSSSSPRRHSGSSKNAVVADVDSLMRKLDREQKRTAQLNAQLTLLDHELNKENDRATLNEREMQDIRTQISDATRARREAEQMLARTQEQLQVARSQFDTAVKEIERAQGEIDALDKERQEAEDSARRAQERAKELLLEMKVQDARRQGWEEGMRQGIEEGARGGEMEGSRHGRRDGAKESRVIWEVRSKRFQHVKVQQAKVEKTAQKHPIAAAAAAAASAAETRARNPATYSEEDSDEEPVLVPRDPEWEPEYLSRSSSRSRPYSRPGSVISNISDPHLAGEPSPIRIRSPAPLESAPPQSRGSRHSSGRTRTGSDPTSIGGWSTPASEFDLLQQPPGRLGVLSPITEASFQIASSPVPTIVPTPHGRKLMFGAPSGGPGSARKSDPKSSSGSSFIASSSAPDIDILTDTPHTSSRHSSRHHRNNIASIHESFVTVNSGYPGSDELVEPLDDPYQQFHQPYAMAELDIKGQQPMRPPLNSSPFIPPNQTSGHSAYSVHDGPTPDLWHIPGYGGMPVDPTRPPSSPRW